jgi:hypothetical protein
MPEICKTQSQRLFRKILCINRKSKIVDAAKVFAEKGVLGVAQGLCV